MIARTNSFLRTTLFVLIILLLVFHPLSGASAAASLTITPLTWNIIGLDSNNVNVGPHHFPVGARVCNNGDTAASNVEASFVWDSANALINIRPGTNQTLTLSSLAAGACTDFYFEVQVTRSASAYDTTRRYHITVTADGGLSVSTPTPRELYVEHLVSQNRNAVTDVRLEGVSIPNGGTMTLLVGETYTIQLVGNTATQGYEQIESFINFPNTIFQVLSVVTTYSAESSPTLAPPYDSLYGDACVWENNPNSPNYLACLGVGKAGGNITVTYQIRILQAPSAPLVNPSPLSTLIYDFSGSSFHYNADFGVSSRYAYVLDPAAVTIAKNFSPDPTVVGGVSTLTFTLTNPTPTTLSGLSFTDVFPTSPGAMTVASTPAASTTGCGTPTFAPTAGATSLAFSNGSLAPNSTCTIKVNVTVPTAGTYNNTSSNLLIGTLDTGNSAADSLTVNTASAGPAPVCGLTMAQWTFTGYTNTTPPTLPAPNTVLPNVTTAAISLGGTAPGSLFAESDSTSGSPAVPSMLTYGWANAGPVNTATYPFIQFAIDTSKYTQVNLQFNSQAKSNGPENVFLYYSTNGTTWTSKATFAPTTSWVGYGPYDFTGQASTTGITYFRLYGTGANTASKGADLNLDQVTFTGCGTPSSPTISKSFLPNPVAASASSTLTFTLTNPNTGLALSGIAFSDTLPAGLSVSTAATSICGGTLSTTAPQSISFSGGSLAGGASCNIPVSIAASASGIYDNISGFVSSTEGGTNTGSTGIATASLTVLQRPSISKLFAPNPILTGGTSTLTFTISNPNLNNALTGVAFSDTYPAGLQNTATPGGTTTCTGGVVIAVANGNSANLSGATMAAGGSCTVSVNVTASTANTYSNVSGAVSSTNAGAGNTASDTLTVNAPNPSLALLKRISTGASGPWTNYVTVDEGSPVYYQFTVENTGDVPFSPVSVSDPQVSTASCTWPATLPVAVSGNDNHLAVCVVGPVTVTSGTLVNTATATGTFGGTPYSSTASSARYSTPELTHVKSAAEISFTMAGDMLNYSYLVTNSGFAPLLGPVTVSDDKATVICPAVGTVGDNDEYLDPGEALTCTAAYAVTATDVTNGSVTNTASATADGVTSNEDEHTVNILRPDLTVTKTNDVGGSVARNSSFNWTITVTNSGIADASFSSGQTILSDPLPVDALYSSIILIGGGLFGPVDCEITSNILVCTANGAAVILPPGESISATIDVTPTAGDLTNIVTVDPDNSILEINESNNTGSDTVTVIAPPLIEKHFVPEIIDPGETSTLTFQIFNSNPGTALTGVAFTDNLPASLTLAADVVTPQCGGTLTGTAGGSVITLTGGAIPASDDCTITTTVTAPTDGTYLNTTGNVSSTNGGTGNTASYTLTVTPLIDLSLDKQVSNAAPDVGGIVTFTLVVANAGPSAATNIVVTDVVPSGYSYVPLSIAGGDARSDASPTTSGLNWTITSLASGANTSLTYQAQVLESGVHDNYAEITSHNETDTDSTPNNGSSNEDDDDLVSVMPVQSSSILLTKTPALDDTVAAPAGTVNAGDAIAYTFSVENMGNVTITSIDVTDPLLPGLVCSIATLAPGATASCTAAENIYTLTQADVDAGSRPNTATATGQDPGNNDVSDSDTQTTNLPQSPSIVLTKSATLDDTVVAPSGVINAGDTITYNFSVENTGNVTITDIDVTDPLLTALVCTVASLAPGVTQDCSVADNVYTLTQADIDAGSLANTATATGQDPGENDVTDMATQTTPLTQVPSLNIVKEVSDDNLNWQDASVSVSVGDTVYFRVRVSNIGNTTLTGLAVDDGMPGCLLARGTDLTGDDDNVFEAGEEWLYTCSIIAVVGTNDNTATADTNETPQDSDTASYIAGVAVVADPAISKSGSPSQAAVGETVTFTLTVTNEGNAPASNVVVTDPLPAMFDVTAVNVTGAPLGTLVNVTPSIGTGTAPYTVVVTLGDDLRGSDIITINIVTTVNSLGSPPVNNTASLTSSSLTDVISNNSALVTIALRPSSPRLPNTGFARGIETILPSQPASLAYAPTDVILAIPSLGVKIPIVGVPQKNGTWNVAWLGEQAGWLQGSAFPSWSGNSVLTSHVYLSNGLPGPFVNLNQLKYGDRIVVHAYGQKYTFAVQTNEVVEPTDASVMKHEEKSWLTLVTCKEYDQKTNTYLKRVVVRAVLVSVDWNQ